VRFATITLLLVGCTMPNPDYVEPGVGGGGSGSGGGGVGGMIDAGTADLAMKDGAAPSSSPDLSSPPECQSGDRSCANGSSVACVGGKKVPDRICPSGPNGPGSCQAGYCELPTDAPQCDFGNGPSEDYCYQQVSPNSTCVPFITGQAGVTWACGGVVGTKASGDACTNGAQCRSGLCGSNGTCFRPCTGVQDCPQHSPALSCKPIMLVVEGVPVTAHSCVP
jgi:hypothetical protein